MLRVAIIGLGPKGLFALERLCDHARALRPDAAIAVDVYEPHPAPGAGPVYDPTQPAYLRMNIADDAVDMWWPGDGAVPAAERRSFAAWRGAAGDGAAYSPRGDVGRYLTDGLARVLRHAPPRVRVTLRRARAH
ncbi:MAG: FAD/NAD(P)-binding protein, partial [Solirubrobacteraceae bacterium]